jgi:hypothetical protein
MMATSKFAPAAVRRSRLPESHDDYPHVVVRLGDRLRVIESACRLQWIVQRRTGDRWRGQSYCWTREALLRCAGSDAMRQI